MLIMDTMIFFSVYGFHIISMITLLQAKETPSVHHVYSKETYRLKILFETHNRDLG